MDFKKFQQTTEEEIHNAISKYCFIAFNDKQFNKGLEKLQITKEEVVFIGTGCYSTKAGAKKVTNILKKHEQTKTQLIANNDCFLADLLYYTMANHEYCITGNDIEILYHADIISSMDMGNEACKQELQQFQQNERMQAIFADVKAEYMKEAEENNYY